METKAFWIYMFIGLFIVIGILVVVINALLFKISYWKNRCKSSEAHLDRIIRAEKSSSQFERYQTGSWNEDEVCNTYSSTRQRNRPTSFSKTINTNQRQY